MKQKLPGLSARKSVLFCTLWLTTCFVPAAIAEDSTGLPSPNWNRAEALQAAAIPPNQQELQSWLQTINAGQADQVLASLQQANSSGHPAFEAQLFDLALALAEAPHDASIDELLLWLTNYPSTVLVAHEEHADYGVPLYPVAAAAMGSVAERQRSQARKLSSQLLNSSPQQWIERYLSASPLEQQGFEHSLRAASPDAVLSLATAMQNQLPQHSQLAGPAGELASLLSDPQLFLAAYQNSQGATAVSLLREANWRLDAAQRSQLLTGMMALDAIDKRALAISMLAPTLHSNPAVSENLLQLMDDPELGAAAALALVGHPDQQVQARLQDMRQTGGLKGQRAAMALDQSVIIEPGGDPK